MSDERLSDKKTKKMMPVDQNNSSNMLQNGIQNIPRIDLSENVVFKSLLNIPSNNTNIPSNSTNIPSNSTNIPVSEERTSIPVHFQGNRHNQSFIAVVTLVDPKTGQVIGRNEKYIDHRPSLQNQNSMNISVDTVKSMSQMNNQTVQNEPFSMNETWRKPTIGEVMNNQHMFNQTQPQPINAPVSINGSLKQNNDQMFQYNALPNTAQMIPVAYLGGYNQIYVPQNIPYVQNVQHVQNYSMPPATIFQVDSKTGQLVANDQTHVGYQNFLNTNNSIQYLNQPTSTNLNLMQINQKYQGYRMPSNFVSVVPTTRQVVDTNQIRLANRNSFQNTIQSMDVAVSTSETMTQTNDQTFRMETGNNQAYIGHRGFLNVGQKLPLPNTTNINSMTAQVSACEQQNFSRNQFVYTSASDNKNVQTFPKDMCASRVIHIQSRDTRTVVSNPSISLPIKLSQTESALKIPIKIENFKGADSNLCQTKNSPKDILRKQLKRSSTTNNTIESPLLSTQESLQIEPNLYKSDNIQSETPLNIEKTPSETESGSLTVNPINLPVNQQLSVTATQDSLNSSTEPQQIFSEPNQEHISTQSSAPVTSTPLPLNIPDRLPIDIKKSPQRTKKSQLKSKKQRLAYKNKPLPSILEKIRKESEISVANQTDQQSTTAASQNVPDSTTIPLNKKNTARKTYKRRTKRNDKSTLKSETGEGEKQSSMTGSSIVPHSMISSQDKPPILTKVNLTSLFPIKISPLQTTFPISSSFPVSTVSPLITNYCPSTVSYPSSVIDNVNDKTCTTDSNITKTSSKVSIGDKPIEDWSVDEVAEFVKLSVLRGHENKFMDHLMDGESLTLASPEMLNSVMSLPLELATIFVQNIESIMKNQKLEKEKKC